MSWTEERTDGAMTAKEEVRLIWFLESKGWTAEQILELLKYIKR